MRTVYVNGQYVAENEARVSVFDRGFLFADAVYEVSAVVNGKLLAFDGHIARLRRSLNALQLSGALSDEALLEIHQKLIELNQLDEGLIYLQITRGEADRNFRFPPHDTPLTVVLFSQAKNLLVSPLVEAGTSVVVLEDLRWQRCDIKTVQLLYPSLAKMQALEQGADDAWLVRDGLITEGTSNNAFILTKERELVTRELSDSILHGITRKAVLSCAKQLGLTFTERAFTVDEAEQAMEAFSTSASTFVMPVVNINGNSISNGKPGPVSRRLRETYINETLKTAV